MRNKFLYLLIFLPILCSNVYAQNIFGANTENEIQTFNKPSTAHAAEYLQRFYKATGFNPDTVLPYVKSLQKAAFNFEVGSKLNWKSVNFITNKYYNVSSTCRAKGQYCYIFVEDSIWNKRVDDVCIQKVTEAFEYKTPANENQGIYLTNTQIFGDPPDIDGDPRIIILILDIEDGFNGKPGSGYLAGYFNSINQIPKSQDPNSIYFNSNQAEIYYLDGVENNLTTEKGLRDAMSTTAHEFQHMIHYHYYNEIGKSQITFYNEMCSLSAEFINGYPLYNQILYSNEPNIWLESWREDNNVLKDYSRAAKLGIYLYEQFGGALFTKFLANGINGIAGLNKALAEIGSTSKMADILPAWFMANLVNDKSINKNWGYRYNPIALINPRVHVDPNISIAEMIQALAVQYISFAEGKNLTFNYSCMSASVKAVAFKFNQNNSITYENVAVNTYYNVPEFGTTISKIIFAIYNVNTDSLYLNEGAKYPYSYKAGAKEYVPKHIELAYDTGRAHAAQPTISFVKDDSIAVVFDGVPGYKLDSIRVVLKQAGSMNGGVWKYSGVLQPTPLGQKLASITATSTKAVNPSGPFRVAYNDWVKIDLRGFNIDASQSFAVGFIIAGEYVEDGSGDNRVMVEEDYGGKPTYRNFTYLHNPEEGPPGWLYLKRPLISVGELTYYYLIRAYIGLITGIEEVVELLPVGYSLDQNFPNPFNPKTIINYALPKAGKVQIKVFDALGREVRLLVNEEKNLGNYSIIWDSTDNSGHKVSSGIYFYTINAGDFFQAKKMVLIK